MSANFVPEEKRLGFAEELGMADRDSRTTGYFALLIAPMDNGTYRCAVLQHGHFEPFPVFAEAMRLSVRELHIDLALPKGKP